MFLVVWQSMQYKVNTNLFFPKFWTKIWLFVSLTQGHIPASSRPHNNLYIYIYIYFLMSSDMHIEIGIHSLSSSCRYSHLSVKHTYPWNICVRKQLKLHKLCAVLLIFKQNQMFSFSSDTFMTSLQLNDLIHSMEKTLNVSRNHCCHHEGEEWLS